MDLMHHKKAGWFTVSSIQSTCTVSSMLAYALCETLRNTCEFVNVTQESGYIFQVFRSWENSAFEGTTA